MAWGRWLGYCPDMPGIVIVGAGFGGIGMGIALKKAGYHDFVILDKARDLGGTWRDNQYPGCACDVPSPLYSYSFELNPDWSRLFAPQQEIWDYLRNCARKYRLDEHISYGARSSGWTGTTTPGGGTWRRSRTASCAATGRGRSCRPRARCTCRRIRTFRGPGGSAARRSIRPGGTAPVSWPASGSR